MDNDINMWKQLGETIQHGNPGDSLGAAVLLDSSGRNLVPLALLDFYIVSGNGSSVHT